MDSCCPFTLSFVLASLTMALLPVTLNAADTHSKQTTLPAVPHLPKPTVKADPNRTTPLSPNEYLPPEKLRAGMTGYGLTVFQGNKIERFGVTVLGVVHKANNGRDLILVKLGGPTLKRVSDIIAGMSGSPVYINGKIIGAVAYGSQFTRESIGYVTPIADMLESWDSKLPQNPEADDAAKPVVTLPTPVQVAGSTYNKIIIAKNATILHGPGVLTLHPLNAKVTVSGVSGARFASVANALAEWGLEARQGGGVATSGLVGSPLVPGGAIAMSLATGDIDITGIGTLTYRKGNRVAAFGHPFLGIGPVAAPMFSAYIHDIEPSFAESHKVGSPVALVGTFSQDRPYSISGKVGAAPSMLPITVRVNDHAMGRSRTFRARVLKHPAMASRLISLAATTAIAEIHGQPGEVTASVTTTVDTDGYGKIRRVNRVQDGSAIEAAATDDLKNLLTVLTSNGYGRVGIKSVALDVDITAGRQSAAVDRIFLKQTRYAPGDTVEIGVVLKPYKQPEIVRTMRLVLPTNTPIGTHTLTVQGGPTGAGVNVGLLALFLGRGPDYSGTTNVAQMLRRYNERERNDALIARIALPTASLSVRGEKMSGLPANLDAAMRIGAGRTSGARMERDEYKEVTATEFVLSGMQSLPIRVSRPGQSDNPAFLPPSDSEPSSGSRGTGDDTGGRTSGTMLPAMALPRMAANALRDETSTSTINADTTEKATIAPPAPEPIRAAPPQNETARPDTPVKIVGRQPGVFKVTAADFRAGVREGVAVTVQGGLRLAPKLLPVASSTEPYFWCLTSDGADGVFAGSGDNGRVYHVAADGKCRLFAQTNALEVHALARASDGTIYAGTSPNGRVEKIGADGKPVLFFQADAKYILALLLSPDGKTLYVAVGGPKAKVYAVPIGVKGEAAVCYESDEGSVTTLAAAPDSTIYAGTAPNGLVLRVVGPMVTHPEIVYDATETAISGLAVDKNNVVYAATAPRGLVYRIAGGVARVLLDKAPAGLFSSLALAPDGMLYAASGANVVALNPEAVDTVHTFAAPTDIQILHLFAGENGKLWAATGNIGGVYTLGNATDETTQGEFTSAVYDAKARAAWGTVRFAADIPSGASVAVQTRTGDTAEPDSTWSAWSASYTLPNGEPVASPSARYLQYRAHLAGGIGSVPTLHSMEVFYLPPNQTPQVTLQFPRGGEVLRGNKAVRWTAADPDRDTLSYEVQISGDNGKTWQIVRGDAPKTTPPRPDPAKAPTVIIAVPPAPAAPQTSVQASDAEAKTLTAIQAELAKHPEMSAEMRARILADAPAQLKAARPPETPPADAPSPNRDTSLPFDTSRYPDGTYLLKVTATDKPANPNGALSADAVTTAFKIVNRPPVLSLSDKAKMVQPDKTVRVEGVAMHPLAAIRAVQFRVDNGEWQAATANDGIFDSLLERFAFMTVPLTTGQHTIEVQAIDEAGNLTMQKVTVSVGT